MKREHALVFGTIAAMGVAFVSGASISSSVAKPDEVRKPDVAKPVVTVTQRTAVFNMAAVMRDFGQAKYQVWLLNNKKTELSKNLLAWRAEYIQHQQDIQKNSKHPELEQKTQRMLDLARKIEDEDKKINKQLNDDASAIINDLYDMMKEVVDKTAEQHGFQIVFAYPDAVTPQEQNSPYIKELKLKPPAAQPFYVAADVDITARVVKTLNEKYPPIDPKTKKPVDVDKLDVPTPPLPAPARPSHLLLPPGMAPVDWIKSQTGQ